MKRILFICMICALSVQLAGAQGIQFFKGSWNDVMAEAKSTGKPVFIDVYTSWCMPCKKMAKETFTQKEIGDYFNVHFVNYQIDAEKGEGISIARQYKVTAYPTCLFVLPNGKLVHTFLGFQTVKQLLKQGQQAVKNAMLLPDLEKMDKEYQAGNRDKNFLMAYCGKRKDFGQKGGQPLNELLQQFSDEELGNVEYAEWLKSSTIYDKELVDRLVRLVEAMKAAGDKKAFVKFDNTVMATLSTYLNDAIDNNRRQQFDHLFASKERLDAIDVSNRNNGMLASMGGGISYTPKELIRLTFLRKNNYVSEFRHDYADYMAKIMRESPTDSLLLRSNAEAQAHYDFMNDASISKEEKNSQDQSYGFLKLLTSVSAQLEAGSLFSSWDYYWGNRELDAAQKHTAVAWLKHLYATWRNADLALPIADKLLELGQTAEAKLMLQDLVNYLKLTGDEDKQLNKVLEKLKKL
ncbi:thioredoxin family protein [Prevotella sp. KH2C16]|uniref:thioredoxin family protein n=1 Tax=Prevotella sp. KH2C16 TaxID=1855325 RepID=UPI0008E40D20|nr:thioredoxin family protein [Prevotella sp. KH2C16]SFF91419.1 Thioredoxin-like [Prevotella sp. KH2C16]